MRRSSAISSANRRFCGVPSDRLLARRAGAAPGAALLVIRRGRDHLNSHRVPGRGAERAVAGHYCRVERLGECDVHRVVRRKVLTQFPRTSREIEMAVPNYAQQPQVVDRFFSTLGKHLTRAGESPQRAEDLHVEEMGRVGGKPGAPRP